MAFEIGSARLFGVDVSRPLRDFKDGWSEALRWPAFKWLSPGEPVRVVLDEGAEEWAGAEAGKGAISADRNAARAFVLPDELVLVRTLTMPSLTRDDLYDALLLQVSTCSPFSLDDSVWGWSEHLQEDGRLAVRLAISSRTLVEAFLAQRGVSGSSEVEVWAPPADDELVINGFGENARLLRIRKRRRNILVALALLAIAACLTLLTPFMLLRAQAIDAQVRYAALEAEAAPSIAMREQLLSASTRLEQILQTHQSQVDLGALLTHLTELIPDTAYLERLELNGLQVRIGGVAGNAAALLDQLGSHPGFKDVRTPSAIARRADGKETFFIEFTVVPTPDSTEDPAVDSPSSAASEAMS